MTNMLSSLYIRGRPLFKYICGILYVFQFMFQVFILFFVYCCKGLVSRFNCLFCSVAIALLVQNYSLNNETVLLTLCCLKFAQIIISLCSIILFIIVLVVRVVLSYLMMLFLDCQVSYMIICVVVKINFLVSLFVLVAFNVSNCCCKVKGCPVNLVKYV